MGHSKRSPDGAAAKSGASAGSWTRGPRIARRWRSIRATACFPSPARHAWEKVPNRADEGRRAQTRGGREVCHLHRSRSPRLTARALIRRVPRHLLPRGGRREHPSAREGRMERRRDPGHRLAGGGVDPGLRAFGALSGLRPCSHARLPPQPSPTRLRDSHISQAYAFNGLQRQPGSWPLTNMSSSGEPKARPGDPVITGLCGGLLGGPVKPGHDKP